MASDDSKDDKFETGTPEGAVPVSVQLRSPGETSVGLTVYGVTPEDLLDEIFRDQLLVKRRVVRRDRQVYSPPQPTAA